MASATSYASFVRCCIDEVPLALGNLWAVLEEQLVRVVKGGCARLADGGAGVWIEIGECLSFFEEIMALAGKSCGCMC